ncbi:sulfatase-like hydrolase/transferase [Flammeovirga kamogawensis]|uniref:Sulfatase-like hydrolase/transferase n=1 Tax=Flammeovirga kamogawensis TaxID=373891 RepID=A0ABX8H358_9BACT|nr:sulfatase-like hydrolase/transferase [Flammeovirga kamogawensis]MBB6463275.1 arylsulfatase [Flammeovirga kamogawensis]QWG09575.1 sulfatase-like hydrolase/transferase [Flammeovirga kamogawensis]TRX65089.1 arylsulfatase [Flammeovirga kamogawensis]
MKKIITSIILSLLSVVSFAQNSNNDRPNILLIVGDDMGFADIGPYGSEIDTPVLDSLAGQGVAFTNFHATPVCSVTRSEVLTGNNNIEVGLGAFDYAVYPGSKGKPGYEGYLTRNTVTIAQLLSDAGYNTYTAGKWHLGGVHGRGQGPSEWGFQKSYGIYVGGSNHWNQDVMLPDVKDPAVAKVLKEGKIPDVQKEKFYENGQLVDRPIGVYSNDLYTNKMLEYMNDDKDNGKPFFAYMAFTTAHFPIQAPKEYIDKYYEYYLTHGYEDVKKKRFEMLKKYGIIDQSTPFPDTSKNPLVKPWESLTQKEKEQQARVFATYAGMIDSQDHSIGRIMDYLRENNKLDNTLIIYLTDNGPEGTDLRGKLSNPLLNKWVNQNFDGTTEHVGEGNTDWQIGTSWANAATGTLQWWKGFVSEGGIRVPLIVVPPKNDKVRGKGVKVHNFTSVKDIPMTILAYANVEHPKDNYKGQKIVAPSGISIKSFLEGKTDTVRTDDQYVAFELFGNKYIVEGNYKAAYVRKGMWGDGEWHLFDINLDPGETRPLEVQQPELMKKLIKQYDEYATSHHIIPVKEDWNPWTAISH